MKAGSQRPKLPKVARYVIHYGYNLSTERFSAWKPATDFMKHCVDTGVNIRGVSKLF